jgi:exodeoxyribonuclease V beta subunit
MNTPATHEDHDGASDGADIDVDPNMNMNMGASHGVVIDMNTDDASLPLQPELLDLWGSRLIEASAGTGKTWTIAALYLRLVLGHGNASGQNHGFARPLRPAEILVMTFTRAATRELSDRIRARLIEAAQCFRGDSPYAPDAFLATLLADYPNGPARSHAAWLLDLAAQSMDEAAVTTIDAWCQRMLREHAFDSGNLFDETLVADEEALQTEASQDYWRQACYPLDAQALAQVMGVWRSVDALVKDMRALVEQATPEAAFHDVSDMANAPTLAEVLAHANAAHQHALDQLRQGWAARAQGMQDWLDGQLSGHKKDWDGRKLSPKHFTGWLATLAAWANGERADDVPDLKTGWERLAPEGLQQARKPEAAPFTPPPVFAEFAALRAACDALPQIGVALRQHAAAWVRARVLERKRLGGHFGFADLLQRLHDALQGPHAQRLRERLVQQYPVALIDEFQDTSSLQYQIFDRIYRAAQNDAASALLLIGDPKQSIYGFRGADIASYLQARRATAGRHYALQTNFRSTATLVDAVNHCFAQAEGSQAGGAFGYRHGKDNPLPFAKVQAHGLAAQLVDGSGPLPALTLVHALETHNSSEMRERFSEVCAAQIVAWLGDPTIGFAKVGGGKAIASADASESEITGAGTGTGTGTGAGTAAAAAGAASASAGADAGIDGDADKGRHRGDNTDADGQPSAFTRLRPADIAILVRTGKEATAVRLALEQRGVASVYLSDRDSVFDSPEAHDLVHWLRAVANPQDVRLVRAGLASATLGLGLDELAWLAQDDAAFDQRLEQLRLLRTVWRTQGVLAMLRQTLHQLNLTTRWRDAINGERRLTNFLHLAELLQTAGGSADGEHALIRWLLTQIEDSAAPPDAHIVRLESDADLVKVVTIHKSKGLQYPVVCLPFACSFRAKERKGTTFVALAQDDGERQVLLQFSDAQLAQADADRLREDLRLLYVALTRAQHRLWLGFSALRVGNSADCATHKSALGRLLGGEDANESTDWQARLHALAEGCAGIALQAAPAHSPRTPLARAESPAPLRPPLVYQAQFERDWAIGSFSRMVKNLAAASTPSELSPIHQIRPADDEGEGEYDPDARKPISQTLALPVTPPSLATALPAGALSDAALLAPQPSSAWHSFARGAQAGNFLHAQLEWLAGEQFALADDPALQERLRKRCERAGHGAQADALVAWLTALVQSPLPGPEAALCALDLTLPEMEFWLVAQRMDSQAIDALCRAHRLPGVPRAALAQQQLQGMLMGFADLVFEHQGRYWVLDYKSNHLGPDDAAYTEAALAHSMAEHRYDVQASLYLLALHRLLKARLGTAYDPARQLGGAVYLYLRGVRGPARGVCLIPPNLALLGALEDMLAPLPEAL